MTTLSDRIDLLEKNLEQKFDVKMNRMETRLVAKLDALELRVINRYDDLENRIGRKLDTQNEKVANMHAKIYSFKKDKKHAMTRSAEAVATSRWRWGIWIGGGSLLIGAAKLIYDVMSSRLSLWGFN